MIGPIVAQEVEKEARKIEIRMQVRTGVWQGGYALSGGCGMR